jgi:DNA repair protein RecO (recombination protein O)
MIYPTKGIVLRTIKYGETSVITTIFTELFGIQSYLVNGVRSTGKSVKSHYFQPASLLELQVYHNELKNLQRIKEISWNILYQKIFSNVPRNAVALFMVELLLKSLKQPEKNLELYDFCETAFTELDSSESSIVSNFPILFSLQLIQHLGFRIHDNFSGENVRFNLLDGNFTHMNIENEYLLDFDLSRRISDFLKMKHLNALSSMKLNKNIRKSILDAIAKYYLIHLPDFSPLKTLPVLHEVFS